MSERQVIDFVPLFDFEDNYEILNVYPYTIRRKKDHYEISESLNGQGYVQVNLNGHRYRKHILIAKQFIPNDDPENKTEVDHRNRNRSDYHLSNLRWVSSSTNDRNRISHKGIEYKYVDEINEDSIVVNDYGIHQFEDYYYDETVDKFYFWNGCQFRELHINEKQNGYLYVYMISTEGKTVQVMYSKFKKLYGIV